VGGWEECALIFSFFFGWFGLFGGGGGCLVYILFLGFWEEVLEGFFSFLSVNSFGYVDLPGKLLKFVL